MWDTPLQLTTPETDSGLTGEPSPTDYVWNVKLACRKDTDAAHAFDLMARHRVRNAFLVPTTLKMMRHIETPRQQYDVRLRSIFTGGEAVGEEVIRWAREELGVTPHEGYGQTEVNLVLGNCSMLMPVRPGSMGRPIPGHVVDVVDEAGQPVPVGDIGEVAIRRPDPVMFLGYWHNATATTEKFVGDWALTGDLARKDEDGYFWFVGRKDDVIASGGYRIGPGEIEDCLAGHSAVAVAAAVGSPDAVRGRSSKPSCNSVRACCPRQRWRVSLPSTCARACRPMSTHAKSSLSRSCPRQLPAKSDAAICGS